MSSNKRNSVYFPGLNGLRFFAAFAVFVTHVELTKKLSNAKLPSLWRDIWNETLPTGPHAFLMESYPLAAMNQHDSLKWYHIVVTEAGGLGVLFFFVLSGFLITYLLLKEREVKQRVSIKNFYLRRILRIWPLYFLIIALGFFVLPEFSVFNMNYGTSAFASEHTFWYSLLLCVIMLPNFVLAFFGPMPNISPTWSIGVEEQFYLMWPWIVRKILSPLPLFVFIIAIIGLKVLVLFTYSDWGATGLAIKEIAAMSKFESMGIGGLGAWWIYNENKTFNTLVKNRVVEVCGYLLIPVLLFGTHRAIQDVAYLAYSILFLIIIVNVSTNPRSLLKLENRVLRFLGNLSYGFYMYHMMISAFTMNVYARMVDQSSNPGILNHFVVYVIAFALSLLVAHLSYAYFEKRFILYKDRFSAIVSGTLARMKQ